MKQNYCWAFTALQPFRGKRGDWRTRGRGKRRREGKGGKGEVGGIAPWLLGG